MINIVLLTALVSGLSQEPVETTAFNHKESGFIFNYPKDWNLSKLKNSDRLLFTVDGQTTAELDIFGLSYSEDPETWQLSQTVTAKNQKRTVAKQWQEEILGVPLLLTQTTWVNEGREMVAESGIIYAATRKKLIFRLTAPKSAFDKVSYAWRTALQSLRTDDGTAPRPFDRTKGPGATDIGGDARTVFKVDPERGKKSPAKLVVGDLAVETVTAGKKTLIRYIGPWKVEPEGSSFAFSHPDVSGKVMVEALSTLDSSPPGRYLLTMSGKSLEPFSKVSKREEPLPGPSKSGMVMTYVLREGPTKDGFLMTLDAVGTNAGSEFWSLAWNSSDKKTARKQVQKVMDLVRILGVELAP